MIIPYFLLISLLIFPFVLDSPLANSAHTPSDPSADSCPPKPPTHETIFYPSSDSSVEPSIPSADSCPPKPPTHETIFYPSSDSSVEPSIPSDPSADSCPPKPPTHETIFYPSSDSSVEPSIPPLAPPRHSSRTHKPPSYLKDYKYQYVY